MRQVYERVWKGILQVVERHRGQTVCVASHGCAIRNLLCRAKGLPIERIGEIPWLDNTALSILEFSGESCVGVPLMGDASHLSPETLQLCFPVLVEAVREPGGEVKRQKGR